MQVKGGKARWANLTDAERKEQMAALQKARWAKKAKE